MPITNFKTNPILIDRSARSHRPPVELIDENGGGLGGAARKRRQRVILR